MPAEDFTDAIALLKADHRKVQELFQSFENAHRLPSAQTQVIGVQRT